MAKLNRRTFIGVAIGTAMIPKVVASPVLPWWKNAPVDGLSAPFADWHKAMGALRDKCNTPPEIVIYG